MPQKLMTQKEFADKLRAELPELAGFNDSQIVGKVLERRPDLTDKIENPMSGDLTASAAQARAERGSKSLMNPEFWDKHPTMKTFTQAVMNALPGTGVILGGLAAAPETMGTGTIMGGALGAGIGRGAMDIGNQMLGLGETSPMEKAKNIGMDVGITAATPGLMTAARYPIQSARIGAGMLSNAEDALIPRGLRQFMKMPALENFAKGGSKFDPLTRPAGMNPTLGRTIAEPPIVEGQGTLDVINPASKMKVRYVNGKFIDVNTGEELGPFDYKNEFTPWKGAKDISNKIKEAFDPGPNIFPSFKGSPSKVRAPYKSRFSMSGVSDKVDNPKK